MPREAVPSEGMLGDSLPRLYTELASWYHLLTAPEEYGEEAEERPCQHADTARTHPT